MKRLRKFSLKYLVTGVLTALLFFTQTWKSAGNYHLPQKFYKPLTPSTDTVPVKARPDSITKAIIKADTVPDNKPDTSDKKQVAGPLTMTVTDTFPLKISKDSLDAPVNYEAEDSAVVLIQDKKVILYGKTKTTYKDIELTAPQTELDQQTQILTAVNKEDSARNLIDRAKFKQGDNTFQSDTIRYNFKTQKGLTKNTHTMQGEIHLQGNDVKKIGDIIYSRKGVITTCNLDKPHFGFRYDKIKVVNNKVAITGPIHPEFEEVPIPIYLPFGFFPLKQSRHSGFLAPQFTVNEQYGLGLEGLGYYKVLNDYFDLTLRSNIYSYGSWMLNVIPSYRKLYRYQGQLSFSIQNTKLNFKGDPDYVKNKSYYITWNHSADSRARPGTTFSASVNAGSTSYNTYIPNNPYRNFQNQLSSSITYTKSWAGKPYNLTMTANHNQNNSLHLINLNLPDIGFTVNTVYPFQRKELVGGTRWYEKLGIGYNGNIRNQIAFYDTAFSFQQLLDTVQWGGQHSFPISLTLPPIMSGNLIVSPSIGYEQKWIGTKTRRSWNNSTKKVDTAITKGFYFDQRVSTGIGFNTALYGTFRFGKSGATQIRHVIRPTLNLTYSPSLSKPHFYSTQVDTFGNTMRFAEFENSLYGYYGEQNFGGLSFSIDNNLEMKTRSKKDTGASEFKKVRLLDGFGFTGGYNFIADSLKLSNLAFYLRSTLFDKINITATSTLNPYQTDSRGQPINKYAWQGDKFSLGRLTNGSLSVSTDFRSKPKDAKKEEERKKREQAIMSDPLIGQDTQNQLQYIQQNPSNFVDFNIPWSVNMSLSVFYSEILKPDYSGFEKQFGSNLNFNGSFSLTPNWNFSVNGYYDFQTMMMQTFTMSIAREMHCWQMSINVTPIGPYRYFNITISPKSGMLSDLRLNRTRSFYGD